MKKNILYFGIVVLFAVFGFLGNVNFAKADCCIGLQHNNVCFTIGSGGSCPDPLTHYPSPYDCDSIMTSFLCDGFGDPGCCVHNCSSTTMGTTCSNGTYPVAGSCSAITSCSTPTPPPPPSSSTTEFPNPIGFTTVSDLLSAVLNNLMGIIATIAVVFIVIGGIMYLASGGNEAMVTRAKKTWTGAVVGLAIALAAPTFLKEIRTILMGNSSTGGSADAWVSNAITIRQIAVNVLNLLLSVLGILAIIALVVGGGMYLTAYGDEKKIDDGKKIIKYAIIGIVVSLSALLIVRQVGSLFGIAM